MAKRRERKTKRQRNNRAVVPAFPETKDAKVSQPRLPIQALPVDRMEVPELYYYAFYPLQPGHGEIKCQDKDRVTVTLTQILDPITHESTPNFVTQIQRQMFEGKKLTANGETVTIVKVNDDTHLTVNPPFRANFKNLPDGTWGYTVQVKDVPESAPRPDRYSYFLSHVDQRPGICPVLSYYAVGPCFRGGGLFRVGGNV